MAIPLVAYDASWPARFEMEAAGIRRAFGAAVLRVDHVGSTAVPGLAAKPVIDIQVSVATLAARATYHRLLADLGYTHVDLGAFNEIYPFFQKPAHWPCTHHVHLCEHGGEQEAKHLAFRNHLREHPEAAADYLALKRRLAADHDGNTHHSRESYSLAKSDFVNAILARAGGAIPGPS